MYHKNSLYVEIAQNNGEYAIVFEHQPSGDGRLVACAKKPDEKTLIAALRRAMVQFPPVSEVVTDQSAIFAQRDFCDFLLWMRVHHSRRPFRFLTVQ
ncbi:MAG: hypothetical protein P9M15_01765 [Candidatus Electryoneaceae bacterium]|nr:hypothetical protein [Candidatus Electryoneaceae bacterium]